MKIFVSYASANRELVKELVDDLGGDHEVWFDQELSGGQAWWDEILKQILECELFIFTLSEDSIISEPCKREREYAIALNKKFLPVYVADNLDFTQLAPEIAKVHYVDYRNHDKNALKSLQKAISNLGDMVPLPNPLPKAPETPISPLNEIAKTLEQPQLSSDEQRKILYELKALQKGKTEKSATQLLEKLSEHPALLASINKELEQITSTPKQSYAATDSPSSTSVDEKMVEIVREEIRKWLKQMIEDDFDELSLKIGLIIISWEENEYSGGGFYMREHQISAAMQDLASSLKPEFSKMKNWELKKVWKIKEYNTTQKRSRLISKIADETIELNHILGCELKLADIRWLKS